MSIMNEKKLYNKLRIFLSVFGISYSYYIRKCDGIFLYDKDSPKLSDYFKSWQIMENTNEGYLYWSMLRVFWICFLDGIRTSSELTETPLLVTDYTYDTCMSIQNAVKDIDKTIELFNKLLDLGFKFRYQINIDNVNYSKFLSHFKNNENFLHCAY